VKRFSAAIILLIIFFNWFGYSLVVNHFQQKADSELEAKIDQSIYDNKDLFEIKIALHLPYQTTWSAFERYDGEVKVNGVIYKYVKRKLDNDTLHLMCLPNTKKMNLEIAKVNFYNHTNDLTQKDNNGKSKTSFAKNILVDLELTQQQNSSSQFFFRTNKTAFSYAENRSSGNPPLSPEQPPELLLS
jgi:hypothetical protein